jgi:tetratricopeptide (TPR) repeat protein
VSVTSEADRKAGSVDVHAEDGSVAIGGNVQNSTIIVGLGADATGKLIEDARHPTLRLTRFEARTARAQRDNSDASLLSAYRTDVVPLLGREADMDSLLRWAECERDISIRVLTGGAGRGKTRLAMEFARKLGAKGWLAGFATDSELDRFRKQSNAADWGWKAPTLVVIDYAASRADQLHDWIEELVDAKSGFPLRLLLLERQAHRDIGWLATVVGSGATDRSLASRSLLDPSEPEVLPEIDDTAMRRDIFAALLASRRKDLSVPSPAADPEFDRLLRDEKWTGDPLFLMMAGLVAASSGVNASLTLSRADLATTIAQRELDRIGEIAASAGVDANDRCPGFSARHMAVLTTLAQGLTLDHARKLIAAELSALGESAGINSIVDALCDALPLRGDRLGIAPILPDIIGEAAILFWLGNGGVLPRRGIEALPAIQRTAAIDRQVSATLVRIAQDYAASGRNEPVRWLAALAEGTADLGALMQIADQLPDQTLALRELAVSLTQQIVDELKAITGTQIDADLQHTPLPEEQIIIIRLLGTSLNNLGSRLSDLGRREDALDAMQEAVDIYGRLAESRPDAFLPDLAMSLNNLGNRLSELGRHENALNATQEAVDIYGRLAESRPDAFLLALAMSLNNLGNRLSELGRREDALDATQEAVDIYRRLAQSRPDAFLRDLATSLNNLGSMLSDLGRREDALDATQEAVDIRRRLAQSRPDAFLPDLAMSLNNLGSMLSYLGRREDALDATQEAVDIRRRLAQSRPDAFLPALAMSLNNLGNMLSDLGRREDALDATQQAVDIYRRLAQSRADAFLPDLALSLNNLGSMLSDLGRREDALDATQEAVDIRRRLAQSRPDAFLPDLAASLNNLGNMLSYLGRREDALDATQEAVDINRRLAQSRPDAFLPALARSLGANAVALAALDRNQEAAAAVTDALRSLLPYLERYPGAFEGLARAIVADIQRYSETAGLVPDQVLLERTAVLLASEARSEIRRE